MLWIEESARTESNFWTPESLQAYLASRGLRHVRTEQTPHGPMLVYEHQEITPEGKLVAQEFVDSATGLNLGYEYVTQSPSKKAVVDKFRIVEWEFVDPGMLPGAVMSWEPPEASKTMVLDGSPNVDWETGGGLSDTAPIPTPTPRPVGP